MLNLICLAFLALMPSSHSDKGNRVSTVYWMLGTWEGKTSKSTIYEAWEKATDGAMKGTTYKVSGTDTTLLEDIQLLEEEGLIFYLPTVKNQNEGKPVRFKAIEVTDSSLVVENQSHDFPTQIAYRMVHKDSLVATISGVRQGKHQDFVLGMKKVR